MKKTIFYTKQSGFSAIEVLLIIVIAVLVVLVGLLVYSSNSQTSVSHNVAKSQTTKIFLDPSGSFSLVYDNSWSIGENAPGKTEGVGYVRLDSNDIYFTPPNAPTTQTNPNIRDYIQVASYKTNDLSGVLATYLSSGCNTNPTKETINGYSALYIEQTCKSSNNSYVNDTYGINHNGISVIFVFKKQGSGNSSISSPQYKQISFNASNLGTSVSYFVNSIKFNN